MTDTPAGKVPIVACAVASWRFLAANAQLFLPAALIVAAVNALTPVLLSGSTGVGSELVPTLIGSLVGLLFSAAILRKALRSEYVPPLGLTFQQDEARLLGVSVCFGLLLVPAFVIGAIIFTAIAFGQAGLTETEIEAMQDNPEAMNKLFAEALATPAGLGLVIAGLVGFALLSVKLSMISAATIGERKMVFFQTWSWSKGNVARILAAMVLTAFPTVVIELLAAAIAGAIAPAGSNVVAGSVVNGLLGLVGAFLSIPPTVLGAELYRGLRPPGFVAK